MVTSQDKSTPPTWLQPEGVCELGIAGKTFTTIVKEGIALYFIILSREFCVFKPSKLTIWGY